MEVRVLRRWLRSTRRFNALSLIPYVRMCDYVVGFDVYYSDAIVEQIQKPLFKFLKLSCSLTCKQ
jgi:hypothetical protein